VRSGPLCLIPAAYATITVLKKILSLISFSVLSLALLTTLPQDARATGLDFSQLTNATNAAVTSILKTIGLGADHRPYASAKSLGYTLGIDAGLDATFITLPQEFTDALTLLGNTTTFPSALPLPRFNLRKGLPWGLDIGFTTISYQQFSIRGFDLQWNGVTETRFRPSIAIRASTNSASLDVVETTTRGLDFLISKDLWLIEPYFGFGYQWSSGTLNVPSGGVSGLPTSVSASQDFSGSRWMLGLPIKLWLLHTTVEYAGSSEGVNTLGAKVSICL